MKKSISLLATSMALLLATGTASARLIDGRIDFVGAAMIVTNSTEVISFDFDGTTLVSNFDGLVTGDFDGLESTAAPFTDFNVSDTAPIPLWTAGTFTFNITSFTKNQVTGGYLGDAVIGGTGIISSTDMNLDDTAGIWKLTAQGNKNLVSFSSTTVPAPAGAALLGLGLLGFGFARRNKKAS
ncbi:hypothetical protein CXF72_18790 [Psychromonas sp. MB-3u-54]|uniref:PEP-CTERM sorting domain-containing protein n=1 Tax=Psychromonas sp. MB-3u-54 TaxID=2058319 RepID=UPI000C33E0A2|nr:PEP-CTERM sorting domain-containing protein [Psychromonas sp. MB-3u-54]PKH01084.1 hypothetical protein CXF72_18790 [Psychromonas sp. MB-3u-54]